MLKQGTRLKFRAAAVVAFALFFAQVGAMVHAYSHSPGSTQTVSAERASGQESLKNHGFCGDCLNFAPLMASGGAVAVPALSIPLAQSMPAAAPPVSLLAHRTYLAFRSRAPPVTR
jgi:hypothetical protein